MTPVPRKTLGDAWMEPALTGSPHLLRHWPEKVHRVFGPDAPGSRLVVASGNTVRAVTLLADGTLQRAHVDWARIVLPGSAKTLGNEALEILTGGKLVEVYDMRCRMGEPKLRPEHILAQADADLGAGTPSACIAASRTWQALLGEALGSLARSRNVGSVLIMGPRMTDLVKAQRVFDFDGVLQDAFQVGIGEDGQPIAFDVARDHRDAAAVGELYQS